MTKSDDSESLISYSNDTINYGTVKDSDQKKKNESKKQVSFFSLFRYATALDYFLMFFGTLGSIGSGTVIPLGMQFFTNMIDSFTNYGTMSCNQTIIANMSNYSNQTTFDLNDKMVEQSYYLIGLALVSMVFTYVRVSFWMMSSERQSRIMRKKLFQTILTQEMGWFDLYKSGELNSRLTDDIDKIKDGIGDKLSNALQAFSAFLSGMVLGFIRGWKLTLVILSLSPALVFLSFALGRIAVKLAKNELKSYAGAGAVAEEVLTAIRTIFAFNGAKKEHKRYESKLEDARKSGIKKGCITGLLSGFVWIVMNGAYALGFWYGWTLTVNEGFSVGKIILVFFSIIISVFSLGNASQYFSTAANAKGAAYEVFKIIDRKSRINPESTRGEKPVNLEAKIEFKNVSFDYPSREQVKILKSISFKIEPGSTVALVGSSGCGKSTCIQLIERFYDASSGSILIGHRNIQDLNLNWLRSQLGVVNQEPILFGTSILENIKYGKQDATEEQIIEAAKKANAHDFIMQLPKKYDTLVGNRGSQLSGGQKQRIAIARALVRNPKILLLDEATSALDNESESIVQQALDKARLGRTTIIVAHRLSTIRNADLIYCLNAGQIVECGTHSELMTLKGHYHSLVINQEQSNDFESDTNKKLERLKSDEKRKDLVDIKITSDTDSSKDTKTKNKVKSPSMMRILALNKPEWFYILVGCIACIVSGGANPAFSIVFSKVIAVFQECDPDKQKDGVILYCLIFIGIGVCTFFSNFIMSSMFAISGENMTKRLRAECFKTMLTQDLEWFDKEENNIGALTTRLSVETAAVQGATGPKLGNILMNFANLGVGIVVAFISSWVISLVIIAFIPLTILAGILKTKLLTGYISKDKETIEEAGKITNESISNIKTVAILNKEAYFSAAYSRKIDVTYKASIKSANIFGFMLGFSSSIFYYAIAAAFVLGAYLIEKQLFDLNFEKIMRVFSVLIFGAQSVGQAASMMPDYAKAKVAIQKMFELFDRVPLIDNWNTRKGYVPTELDSTSISLESVDFNYPNRSSVKVLDKFSLNIKQGQKIAMVGSSGCGKSTVTQLLERFYDTTRGSIKIGNHDIRDISLEWLRSNISIVSQEPILLDATIAENIAYGDNSRKVDFVEILEAAKLANIHDFIATLPMGYHTNVGSKGTQLSGGQKQRVSIARALIRNPKILLLDEATSALDTESEKVVQEALDRAQEGRTCVIIAHRLSTIRNCDAIFVVRNGQISEFGTHEELIKMNGFYAKLNGKNRL